ncbi:myb-related transcription factor, partner of profilin-like [Rhinatrema bivittatum]|uniref:myb-related transcription factor, partner of profilin-like n=1 Tax=Rhinatrema bivittatum TaxID=194408 RepID=UPI00112A2D1B|nr:myb-related transcription factor, partner of profilin-like [Rhinatrema bivittatum]
MPGKRVRAQVEDHATDQQPEEDSSASQPSQKRTRNARFTDDEKELLCRAVCEKHRLLFKSKLSWCSRKKIWEKIAQDVSSLSVMPRDIKQVQHRWRDTRKEVKEKAAKINAHAKRTGGGPPCSIVLTPVEEMVLRTMAAEVVVGVQTEYGGETEPCAPCAETMDDGDGDGDSGESEHQESLFPQPSADPPSQAMSSGDMDTQDQYDVPVIGAEDVVLDLQYLNTPLAFQEPDPSQQSDEATVIEESEPVFPDTEIAPVFGIETVTDQLLAGIGSRLDGHHALILQELRLLRADFKQCMASLIGAIQSLAPKPPAGNKS